MSDPNSIDKARVAIAAIPAWVPVVNVIMKHLKHLQSSDAWMLLVERNKQLKPPLAEDVLRHKFSTAYQLIGKSFTPLPDDRN